MQILKNKGGLSTAFIKTSKFKAELLTIRFVLPLDIKTAGHNAMAAALISECSKKYPEPEMLSRELSRLYGIGIFSGVEKVADNQIITFSLKGLADRYALGEEKCLSLGADILYELIFNPNLENGVFTQRDTQRIKRVWYDRISGEINDKRIYAKNQLERKMFENLPYGVSRLGTLEDAKNATAEELFKGYLRLINEAEIRITYIGEEYPAEIIEKFLIAFGKNERKSEKNNTNPKKLDKPQIIEERMDITQGKLVMGFLAEPGLDRETYPFMVMSDIFGGGPYSKLFENVREKMSLCYYCSARMSRIKGFLTVDCGVEEENAQKAADAILAQLEDIRNGKFEDSVIEASKKSICDSLNSMGDSNTALEIWYGLRIKEENPISPKEMESLVNSVTREQIIECAKKVSPHTFYFLLPEGDKADEK